MSVYRLDPINPNHPFWQASSVKETMFVGANSDMEAREFATLKTTAAVNPAGFSRRVVAECVNFSGHHYIPPEQSGGVLLSAGELTAGNSKGTYYITV